MQLTAPAPAGRRVYAREISGFAEPGALHSFRRLTPIAIAVRQTAVTRTGNQGRELLREGTFSDHEALGELMYVAVRTGESPYSEAQRRAWVPEPRAGDAWNERLSGQAIFIDEDESQIRGFMSLVPGGYVDFAYIRPSCRGQGVFRLLFEAVRDRAIEQGVNRLWVHASLMAQPAFAAMGFTVIRKEKVSLGSETLERFEMELLLPD